MILQWLCRHLSKMDTSKTIEVSPESTWNGFSLKILQDELRRQKREGYLEGDITKYANYWFLVWLRCELNQSPYGDLKKKTFKKLRNQEHFNEASHRYEQ